MDKSQHVTRSAGKVPPLPPVPPKPEPEAEGARPERMPGTRTLKAARPSALPWAIAGGAALVLVLVIAVAFSLALMRTREQAVLARANADEAQRQARAAEERERLQRSGLETQLEAVNDLAERLRKQVAETRRETTDARIREAEARQKIAALEEQARVPGPPTAPMGGAADEQIREMRELRRQLQQAMETIAAMKEKDFFGRAGRTRPKDGPEAKPGTLPDPGNLGEYAKNVGKTYKFTVTGENIGTIYGSNPYTTDSPLAVAAVHSGALKLGETGVVLVTILRGQLAYRSTLRSGIASNEWGQFEASYKISKE